MALLSFLVLLTLAISIALSVISVVYVRRQNYQAVEWAGIFAAVSGILALLLFMWDSVSWSNQLSALKAGATEGLAARQRVLNSPAVAAPL